MPVKPRFLIGDTMSIICTAPASKDRIQGFRFSRMPGLVTDFRSSKRTFVHTFNITGPQDGGSYTCSYTVFRGSHSSTQSLKSQAVVINVQDRPAKPNLTVTPSSVTIEGQPLVFFCAAPPGDAERRFGFFQGELKVTDGIQEDSGGAGTRLQVEKSGLNQTGNFSCRYEEMTEGRWIESYASDAIQVIVKDPCPPPHLSVEPPSGVVAVGHRLRLTCAAPRDDFRRRFRFFWDGAEVTSGTGDTRDTRDGAELLFPQISQELAGNFSCRVEEEVGGAWVEAPPSRGVVVVVRGPPSQPILLLSPPSDAPDGSESQISLTCLVPSPSGDAQRRFRFYRDGSETTMSPLAEISIPVPSAAAAGAGHFSCQYEEELDGRWVLSPPSATVTLPAPAPAQFGLLPLVIGVVVGVAVLLLGLLLAAWLCRRRRGGSRWRGLRPGDDTGAFPMGDVEVAN
ncbi:alpha-1B-glycoprotein-like [Corvus hawaiiensis]|uniref:alpha-1B-glycoprotein-like n=1 Tax=Corvus hawaiiensis TaxID=134902 RepID=UPI0020195CE7|nr:alpha-1B-glycoprotein-like [Corvus hawaiiensis]